MIKFSANISLLFNEFEFLDRFDEAHKIGFKAVEFQFPYSYDAKQIKEKLDEYNLSISIFNSSPGNFDEGDREGQFSITVGKKYYKIIQKSGGVHAFVDKQTGEVYKPASWRSPAKHVRYDLRIINNREYLLQNADWAGGYLYLRR